MRRLIDIVSDSKDGKIPDHEECFWAMLALYNKLHFVFRDLEAIGEAHEKGKVSGISVALRAKDRESVIADRFSFMRIPPKEFLGDTGNPFSETALRFKNLSQKILDKALKNQQS